MITTVIKDLSEMKAFLKKFVAELSSGDIVGLVGDLGAGKTTFVQLLAAELGVAKKVKSPTFVLMQVYETGLGGRSRGLNELCHVDAYRLKNEKELVQVGLDDYAGRRGVVTLIEWADRVPSYHHHPAYREIVFSIGADDSRTLKVSQKG